MTVTIRQLHPHFFGEVSGVDLRKPLTPQEAARYRGRHGQIRRAAVPRSGHHRRTANGVRAEFRRARESARRQCRQAGGFAAATTGLNDVSNLGKDGKPLPRDSRAHLFNLGNCLWHSDSSFRPIPAKFSLLSARVVNPKGGNTEFADMRAAYDALDDETKAEIEDMICEHSLMYSRGSLGFLDYTEEEKADVQAGAAAPGAHPSGARPQVAVSVVACRRHPRHERAGGAGVAARPHRARHAAANSSMSTNGRCMIS